MKFPEQWRKINNVIRMYLRNEDAEMLTDQLYLAMRNEIPHTHNGKRFYSQTFDGELKFTMDSMVNLKWGQILAQHLKEYEVQECLEKLMGSIFDNEEEITDNATILIPGSDSPIYFELLKYYTPANEKEAAFLELLNEAVDAGEKNFSVPVCDPSKVKKSYSWHFAAGCWPRTDYNYHDLQRQADICHMSLGRKRQYVLFLGTMTYRLVEAEGWTLSEAFNAVCSDSTKLGHYRNSENAQDDFEPTGSRPHAGKCDFGNTKKIVADDDCHRYFWLAGGSCHDYGYESPLATLRRQRNHSSSWYDAVPWFVC